jgi:hypothetical protein
MLHQKTRDVLSSDVARKGLQPLRDWDAGVLKGFT